MRNGYRSGFYSTAAVFRAVMVACVMGALLVAAAPVMAEGRCPPGQYPIGDDRAPGCAPIPSGGGGADAGPTPTGRWIKTWGALSSSSSGDAGVSMGKFSKSDAQKDAISQCAQWGATDCRVDLAFKNTCVAAATAGGGRGTRIQTGADVDVAQARALKECGISACKVVYSGCTKPVFQAFD